MKKPFHIFPTSGYLNSQFQVISNEKSLNLKVVFNKEVVSEIQASSPNPSLITNLAKPGQYKVEAIVNNQTFSQTIEVKDAYRLGSSKLKKAYVFDDIEYVFLVMMDRIVFYSPTTNQSFTENRLSPTEIRKIDSNNLLLITDTPTKNGKITNLGILGLRDFRVTDELTNTFEAVYINEELNKYVLYSKAQKQLILYAINTSENRGFKEVDRICEVDNYEIHSSKNHLIISKEEEIILLEFATFQVTKIDKSNVKAIDNDCNVFELKNRTITCIGFIFSNKSTFRIPQSELNLKSGRFKHIGPEFMNEETSYEEKRNAIIKLKERAFENEEKEYFIKLDEEEEFSEISKSIDLYPSGNGVIVFKSAIIKTIKGLRFNKGVSDQIKITESYTYDYPKSLEYYTVDNDKNIFSTETPFSIYGYYSKSLIVSVVNSKYLVKEGKKVAIHGDASTQFIQSSNGKEEYLKIDNGNNISIINLDSPSKTVISNAKVLNSSYMYDQDMVWMEVKSNYNKSSYLSAYGLSSKRRFNLSHSLTSHSYEKGASDYFFSKNYISSSGKVLINANNAEIKDAVAGEVISLSKSMGKVISRRGKIIYIQFFDDENKKYSTPLKIDLEEDGYKESFMSNDGNFLMLKNERDKYIWRNVETGDEEEFLSGNFLKFSKEGNLIYEEDGTRKAKIIDPLTFEDVTPSNYHYYRFMSPDGKLYAQTATKSKFFNTLTSQYLSFEETVELRKSIDKGLMRVDIPGKGKRYTTSNERDDLFRLYPKQMKSMGIHSSVKLNSQHVIKVEKYLEIGVVGTNNVLELKLSDNLSFYNYGAFSYDNKYFGYVGKPTTKGLVHIFEIKFDKEKAKLETVQSFKSSIPNFASWVCGFSKKGYFATYDSKPDTYLIKCDEHLFNSNLSDDDIVEGLEIYLNDYVQDCGNWRRIAGKNFMCFSPDGSYMALSEQGYDPISTGGGGHQESTSLHICNAKTGEFIDSFDDHGTRIMNNSDKNLRFVWFSTDSKRIMSLSADGVVIIRNIDYVQEPVVIEGELSLA